VIIASDKRAAGDYGEHCGDLAAPPRAGGNEHAYFRTSINRGTARRLERGLMQEDIAAAGLSNRCTMDRRQSREVASG
jgi:hypothetical protein